MKKIEKSNDDFPQSLCYISEETDQVVGHLMVHKTKCKEDSLEITLGF